MDIRVYDGDMQLIGLLDVYESLIWTVRYNGIGDFEIYTKPEVSILNKMKLGYFLRINNSDRVMIIERVKIQNDPENGDKLYITGRSLESLLERRVLYSASDSTYVFDSVVLDTVIKRLFRDTYTPNGSASTDKYYNRKIQNFVLDPLPTTLKNKTITSNCSNVTLLEAIEGLSSNYDFGYKWTYDFDTNKHHFALYEGVNHSPNQTKNEILWFSPQMDNLESTNYSESHRRIRTAVYVKGEDPGTMYKNKETGAILEEGQGLLWQVVQELPTENPEEIIKNKYLVEDSNSGKNAYKMYSATYDSSTKTLSWKTEGVAIASIEPRYYGEYTDNSKIGINRKEILLTSDDIHRNKENGDKITSTEYQTLLNNYAKSQSRGYTLRRVMDGDISTTNIYELYKDYSIGDIVQVTDIYNNTMTARVKEIIISDDAADGYKIYPSFENTEKQEDE